MPPKGKRSIEWTMDTTICNGVWTVTQYDDGTQAGKLSERWEMPLPPEDLATAAQRQAQAEYEREVGARGR